MAQSAGLAVARNRTAVMAELRHLLPGVGNPATALPFGLAALDSFLPDGGLASGALHEIVPEPQATPGAVGFIAAILARMAVPPESDIAAEGCRTPFFFVIPSYGFRDYGRLHGHGLRTLGLDPAHLILVETAHRRDTLWALEEALRSTAPTAVAGFIDKLDLKTSQRLHLAAIAAGLPLLLLRPAATLESSAAATRWRVGTAEAARDRFGLMARPRWHLKLERCRNGRPGEWVVEYDHVTHRFGLAAALADPARAHRAEEKAVRRAG